MSLDSAGALGVAAHNHTAPAMRPIGVCVFMLLCVCCEGVFVCVKGIVHILSET